MKCFSVILLSVQKTDQKTQANLDHASAYGFFADESNSRVAVSEQDVQDVAEASAYAGTEQRSTHYRLRKRRSIMRNPDSHAAQLLLSGCALPEPVMDDSSSNNVITLRIRWLNSRKQQENKMLPVFAEGDTIVGVTEANRRHDEMSTSEEDSDEDQGEEEGLGYAVGNDAVDASSSSSEDLDDNENGGGVADEEAGLLAGGERRQRRIMMRKTRTHTHVFRVCAVYWGIKAYVNMMTAGQQQVSSSSSSMESGRATATQNCFVVCRLVKAG